MWYGLLLLGRIDFEQGFERNVFHQAWKGDWRMHGPGEFLLMWFKKYPSLQAYLFS